jgi:hypothetical protein
MKLTEEQYIDYVLALPRETVTSVYPMLYREAASLTWPYADDGDGDTLKEGVIEGEDIMLTDEDVKRFAHLDYYDGPDAWAFLEADPDYLEEQED